MLRRDSMLRLIGCPHTEIEAELQTAVEHRRNFAIISHPDAGKDGRSRKSCCCGGAIPQKLVR
jgi:hypothetical protein